MYDLEQIAIAHEILHFLFERYKTRLNFNGLNKRTAHLAEEIAALEFSRLACKVHSFAHLLEALALISAPT
jgi:hypothetical protein